MDNRWITCRRRIPDGAYRLGNQDSPYHTYLVTFASPRCRQCRHGPDSRWPDKQPAVSRWGKDVLFTAVPASIMYDAVRLEVDLPDAKPLMKRVPPPLLTAPYNPGPHPTPGLKVAMVPAS